MLQQGWIKLHRQLKDHWINKDSESFHIWINLLMSATHAEYEAMVNKKVIKLYPGQLIFGRKKWAEMLGIDGSKIYRVLQKLVDSEMIKINSTNKYSLITINNWGNYQHFFNKNDKIEQHFTQQDEQQNEQLENDLLPITEVYPKQQNEHTDEQQTNTYKNVKNDKNVVVDIKEATADFSNRCNRVFNHKFNLNKANALVEFIEKGMSVDLIMIAVNKGKLKTENSTQSLSYAYKTLIDWYNEGKRDIADLTDNKKTGTGNIVPQDWRGSNKRF